MCTYSYSIFDRCKYSLISIILNLTHIKRVYDISWNFTISGGHPFSLLKRKTTLIKKRYPCWTIYKDKYLPILMKPMR